jgi:hypothetical protein
LWKAIYWCHHTKAIGIDFKWGNITRQHEAAARIANASARLQVWESGIRLLIIKFGGAFCFKLKQCGTQRAKPAFTGKMFLTEQLPSTKIEVAATDPFLKLPQLLDVSKVASLLRW